MLKDLTYRVVIIDDQEDFYNDYVDIIEDALGPEGYLLTHDRYERIIDLEKADFDDVDLFLVDLKFGKEDKGAEFIEKIRENYLTDILFYSSDAAAISRQKAEKVFEGVFFAVRDENTNEIQDRIEMLIKKMISRSNTPLATRGIVLSGVAELDGMVKDSVKNMSTKLSHQDIPLDRCTKHFYKSFTGYANNIGKHFGCDFHNGLRSWEDVKVSYDDYSVVELVNNLHITDSSKNAHILRELYRKVYEKNDVYKQLSGLNDLLEYRNVLAHVTEEIAENGEIRLRKFGSEDYFILTPSTCRMLRNKIVEYYKLLSEIIESDDKGNLI